MTKQRWVINSDLKFAPLFTERAVWVKNIVTRVTQPYLITKSTSDAISELIVRRCSISQLSPTMSRELEEIGVIANESYLSDHKEVWNNQLQKAKAELQQQSWTVIRKLYNPAGAPAFRSWVEHSRQRYKHGDEQVANRINCHNDILCRSLHSEFSKVLIPLFPELVKSSYCYLGIYHDRAELPKHIDRKQCRWNVSVVLDSSPEIMNLNDSWPIYVEPLPHQQIPLHAIIGDAVIYRGDTIPHWRDPLPSRFNHVSICFFHFVHQEFSGTLN